ncbi:MAG: hypothetical protein K5672_07565 [Bacteroidaceae bacterium]|nr:hypothetical protein [Bacteroidaceae bacterium]
MTLNIIQDKVSAFLKKDFMFFLMANIVFSLSSFLVNIFLPKILSANTYTQFVYIFQMVLFSTNTMQLGFVLALYYFAKQNSKESFNIYYTLVSLLNIGILICCLLPHSFVFGLLKLQDLSFAERFGFALSVIVSSIFLYNKGANIQQKEYHYMLWVSLSAFLLRIAALIYIALTHTEGKTLLLLLIFVCPFVVDIKDYTLRVIRNVRPRQIKKPMLSDFTTYSVKAWLTGVLFIISEKMFLISTKDMDEVFTASLAFASGFIGIIYIFKATFYNFYLAKFSRDNIQEIKNYVQKLLKYALPYFVLLLFIVACSCICVRYIFGGLGESAWKILFVLLMQTGIICYLGMITLLTKTLNYLNLEIILNIFRVLLVWAICNQWKTDNMLTWYSVSVFALMTPEIIISAFILNRLAHKPILN